MGFVQCWNPTPTPTPPPQKKCNQMNVCFPKLLWILFTDSCGRFSGYNERRLTLISAEKLLPNCDVHLTQHHRHTFTESIMGPLTVIKRRCSFYPSLSNTLDVSARLYSLQRLMWNDSAFSHLPYTSPSPVRAVSYCPFTQYCLLSFLSLPCPCPLYMPPFALVPSLLISLIWLPWLLDTYMMCWQTAARGCATTTGDASWIRTSGIASASRGGEGWDATSQPKRSAQMARITREVRRCKWLIQIVF